MYLHPYYTLLYTLLYITDENAKFKNTKIYPAGIGELASPSWRRVRPSFERASRSNETYFSGYCVHLCTYIRVTVVRHQHHSDQPPNCESPPIANLIILVKSRQGFTNCVATVVWDSQVDCMQQSASALSHYYHLPHFISSHFTSSPPPPRQNPSHKRIDNGLLQQKR